MGILTTLIIVILVISFMTFVTFFGRLPALRRTPIAGLHRLIWVHIPAALYYVDQKLTSGRVTSLTVKFFNCMMFDRHPTVVIFFLVIFGAGEVLFIPAAWPIVSLFIKFTIVVLAPTPFFTLYKACAADPGYITPENHAYHMSLYPYDFTLFHPGRLCKTCNLIKPPRSKHCSICKRCIARADHHCIFINSCVGYGNHHWFVLLLLSSAVVTSYATFLGLSILSEFQKSIYPEWSVWRPSGMSWNTYFSIWALGIRGYTRIGSVTLLTMLTSPLIWGLLAYTTYLIYCGTTTNETLKWSEWKEDMRDGYAFARSLPSNRQRQLYAEPTWTRWPVQPDRIMVTTSHGQPPNSAQQIPGEGPWEKMTSLSDVTNLYDLGFWDNLRDIFLSEPFGEREPVSERERPRHRNGGGHPP
ncbi:unnamed protein product [Clonostachys rosea f. rosea IK726]|uniref:Palmitoyltransferase n=2 Tax=Bionectria ochroleuca TaxID=29856 RepID=A0A0B7KDR3_BIOOC|nr:unnamed protein product [Clonostachys rosea f. rosea IK726]